MPIKYILFDVAGTLLHKPTLLPTMQQVLCEYGYIVDSYDLALKHKILSETIHFPDKTNREFYHTFNSAVLYSLGILPNNALLNALFEACSYLPWEAFEDTRILKEIDVPMGILSNFNTSLKSKLDVFFGDIFTHVLVSEELGIAKPQLGFFEKALDCIALKPEEILYIGDSLKLDIEPAKKLNINVLLIDRFNFYPLFKERILSLNDNYLAP